MRSLWGSFHFPQLPAWNTPSARVIRLTVALAAGFALAVAPLTTAAALLVGAAVLVATLIEPLFGLALTLLLGPFGALESIVLGGTSFDSGQLLLVLTLAAWLGHCVARRRILLPRFSKPIALALSVFIGVCALSLLGAPSISLGYKELAKWLQMGLVAWMVADLTSPFGSRGRRAASVYWVVGALILAGLSQALIGIWQFGLRGHGPEHFEILGGFFRAYGTFEQPNPYAGFLGLVLPLAIGVLLGELGRRKFRISRAVPLVLVQAFVVLLLAAAILMSWSRGGWLGAAAGFAAMLFFLPRKWWVGGLMILLVIAVGILAVAGGLVPGSIADRLTDFGEYVQFEDARGVDITPENFAVLERMAHWQAALRMADDNPWLGVGFGNYEAAYGEHALINWPYPLGHAHNYYLNLLAETGVLGLFTYLAFWVAVIWTTARIIHRASYPERGLALGLMGIWAHLSVHHMVDKLYVNNIYLHLGALLGILIVLNGQVDNHACAD